MIQAGRQIYQRVKTFARRYRVWLLLVALLAFVSGVAYSVQSLGLKLQDFTYLPLVVALAITAPAAAILNGIEFVLCARAVRQRINILTALKVSTGATIANILPFPAGLALRGGALIAGGATLPEVTQILLVAGLMWVVLAVTFSGVALTSGSAAIAVFLAGMIGVVILVVWIHRISNIMIAVGFVAVRTGMLVLLTLQLKLCFSALGLDMPFVETAIFVVASIAGVVVSIVPAGLGIVEGVGASLAEFVGASPSGAFLALSISRLLGLIVSGSFVLLLLSVPGIESKDNQKGR